MIIEPVILPANTDWPHDPDREEWWQESVVLGWADPDAEIGGFIRLGHQPNRGFAKLCFGIVSRNGPAYTRSAQDLPYRASDRLRDGFSVADFCSVRFDGRTSRWTARDGDCELDIEVVDTHPAFDFFSLIPRSEVSRNFMSNHIQGGGRFRGHVRIGDTRHDIAGSTYRDHSWGPRHLHKPNGQLYAAWWLGGAFGDDFAYGFGDGRSQGGASMPFNYIVRNGVTHIVEVEDADVTVAFADGMSNRSARVVVRSEELGRLTFEATGYGNVVLELEQKHFELSMPCTVRCGDLVGGGSVETIFNPRNGSDRPFWLDGAALSKGLSTFRDARLVQAPFRRP